MQVSIIIVIQVMDQTDQTDQMDQMEVTIVMQVLINQETDFGLD